MLPHISPDVSVHSHTLHVFNEAKWVFRLLVSLPRKMFMIIFMQVKRSRWMKVWLSARVGFKFRVGLGVIKLAILSCKVLWGNYVINTSLIV